MLYRRNITQEIVAALQDNPVVLINGARQTGKSTLVEHLLSNNHQAEYYTFDDTATLASAKQDPEGFIPVIIENACNLHSMRSEYTCECV